MKHFYLIGYMGTGKSSVAREMSNAMGFNIIDTDDILETRFGKPVADIFSQDGAEAFREAETALLKEIVFDPTEGSRTTEEYLQSVGIERSGPAIVACGGGLPLREENRQILKENGVCIWLQASPEVISQRLAGTSGRPLLPYDQSLESIREMLEYRTPFYADFQVDTDNRNIPEVAAEIVNLLLQKKNSSEEESGDRSMGSDEFALEAGEEYDSQYEEKYEEAYGEDSPEDYSEEE